MGIGQPRPWAIDGLPQLDNLRAAVLGSRRAAIAAFNGPFALLLLTNDTYVELEFPGSKMVGYFARRGSEEWNDDFSFADGSLPDALSGIGFALEKKQGVVAA